MNTQHFFRLITASVFAVVLGLLPARADQPPAAPNGDITVEARGPIHEAFAMPVTATPQPGVIVPKQPPDPVPEEPPDQKPQGDNVIWIPGYWAWDSDRTDFLWVSGFWRVPPPDRQWVPGYWTKVDTGWQWVSGFWASAQKQDLTYVAEPPGTLDAGPSTPAPDDSSNWVPGMWVWRESRFVWRPGYWLGAQPGYIWTPATYNWTPSGYTYVSGYWDYDLADRGLLFAPVSFEQPLWRTPGWAYTPSYCLGLDGLLGSLWVRPGYGHYYFGDYYGPGYARLGYTPWLSYGPRFHDPLYGYYRWHGGPGWLQNQRAILAGRTNGELLRPGRTLAQQNTVIRNFERNGTTINNINSFNRNSLQTVTALNQLGRAGANNLRLTQLNAAQRNEQRVRAQNFQNIAQQRLQGERLATGRGSALSPARPTATTSFRLPQTPRGSVHDGAVRPNHIADPARSHPLTGPARAGATAGNNGLPARPRATPGARPAVAPRTGPVTNTSRAPTRPLVAPTTRAPARSPVAPMARPTTRTPSAAARPAPRAAAPAPVRPRPATPAARPASRPAPRPAAARPSAGRRR